MVRTAFLLALLLVVAACGDGEFLGDEGPALDWIGRAAAPTTVAPQTTTTTMPPPPTRPTSGLAWANDAEAVVLEGTEVSAADVVTAVWDSSSGTDRYVQAARVDIAAALEGLRFPSVLPDDARFISSQLVFSSSGELSSDLVAAFGIWTVEPYTQNRDVAQRAVIFVGPDDIDRAALSSDPSGGCAWFRDRDFRSCEPGPDDLSPSWWLETFEGRTLVWVDGRYRYELRGRGTGGAVVEAMARSMVPITELLNGVGTPLASDG